MIMPKIGPAPAKGRAGLALLMLALVAAASACSPIVRNHGHLLDESALDRIEPGSTSQQQVFQLLGSPSSSSAFDGQIWYYVSQRTERHSFYQREVVAQDVVAIAFDPNGMVTGVERRGLDDAREIELVERETPTEGNELNVVEQFVGNIGRFNLPRDQPPLPESQRQGRR